MSRSPYTTRLDALTFEDVVSFCDQQPQENIRLEYKETFSSKHVGKQIAKEVCAFANTQGGLLIFGVAEQGDRLPEKKPEGRPLGKDARDRVIQACHANIFPPVVPEISEFLPNPAKADNGFLVIRVAASPEIPHTMEDGRRVYIRVYDKSEPVEATIARIEHMLERRNARVSLQAERMDRGINRLVSALGIKRGTGPNSGGFIAVGIGPVIMDAPDMELAKKGAEAARQTGRSYGTIRSVLDGLYLLEPDNSEGWLADDYGNIVFASPSSAITDDVVVNRMCAMGFQELVPAGKQPVADLLRVFRSPCRAVDAAWHLAGAAGLFGLMRLRLICDNLLSLPLAFYRLPEYVVIAATRADTGLDLSFDFPTSDFGPEGWNVSLRAASRLLRGWGAPPETRAHDILDMAEQSIFNVGDCECSLGLAPHRPRNPERCMKCRMQAAETTSPQGSSG